MEKYLLSLQPKIKLFDGPIEVNFNIKLKKPKSARRKYPSVKPDFDNYIKIFQGTN